MNILNTEIEFDFYDADSMERLESALEKTKKEVQKYMNLEEMKTSKVIRLVCQNIFSFFDGTFGEGISKEIFGTQTNLRLCIKALEQVVEAKQKEEKELEEISRKYSPNRISRRAKK